MSALQQDYMLMRDFGIDTEEMVERADLEKAINFSILEIGFAIEQLILLGLTRDEVEVKITNVIKLKIGETNDHPSGITEPAETGFE